MRDILDPADVWLGTPAGAAVFGNKRPVAFDDALSVTKDSAPVTIDVLANDFDPEGAALTLVSASAALGTAVAEADDTVTYTPPPGVTGFDTVIYEIADDLDQRRTARIDVAIVEPSLSIDVTPDNTMVLNAATGVIDITVTTPAAFAGNYQADTADLLGGPVNLAAPSIAGTVTYGQVLTAGDGLWIYDTGAGTPAQGWQWRRGGSDIPGATAASHTVTAADVGQAVTVRETLTDGFGQRSAESPPAPSSPFVPSDDAALIGWWDADDGTTLSQTGGAVSSWSGKGGAGPDLAQGSAPEQPVTANRLLNGRNVLDFTGNAFLSAPLSLPASGDAAFHMALVVDGVTNAFEAVLAADAADNDFQVDAGDPAQFDGRLNLSGPGTPFDLAGGPFAGPMILSVVFDRTGSGMARVFVSDVERGSTAYTTPVSTAVTLHVMANRTLNARADGAVAELVVTGDVSNRAAYHGYLAGKWSLT